MEELVYLFKVANDAQVQDAVAKRLDLAEAPSHVRIATLAKLSNYGYPADAEGELLFVDSDGIVFGVDENPDVPRAFVPWSNIAYMADGADLN